MKGFIKYLLAFWFLGFLGLAGCHHDSTSTFNAPGIADGSLRVILDLNVPMLGGAGLTRAQAEAMIEAKLKNREP